MCNGEKCIGINILYATDIIEMTENIGWNTTAQRIEHLLEIRTQNIDDIMLFSFLIHIIKDSVLMYTEQDNIKLLALQPGHKPSMMFSEPADFHTFQKSDVCIFLQILKI